MISFSWHHSATCCSNILQSMSLSTCSNVLGLQIISNGITVLHVVVVPLFRNLLLQFNTLPSTVWQNLLQQMLFVHIDAYVVRQFPSIMADFNIDVLLCSSMS